MPNPFDQFDAPTKANPFDQFDAPSTGKDTADTVAITGAGFAQGLREGMNPIHLLAGLATMGRLVTEGNPVLSPALKFAGAEKAAQQTSEEAVSALAKVAKYGDFAKGLQTLPGGQMVKDILDKNGLSFDDLSDPNKVAKLRGAEMTTLRRYLAQTARGVGQIAPTALLPGAGVARTAAIGALSGVGGEVGKDIGGPEGELVGKTLPLALSGGRRAVIPSSAAETAAKAQQLGVPLSLGETTGSTFVRAIESMVGSWGGLGVMSRFKANQAQMAKASIERQASSLATPMEDTVAGQALVDSIKGPGGYIQSTKAQASRLYAERDRLVPPDTPVIPANTLNYLTQKTAIDPGAPNLTRTLNEASTKRISPVLDALHADMQLTGGTIPFRSLIAARTRVGEQIEDGILAGTVSQKEARALYGSMSNDIKANLSGPALDAQLNADKFWDQRLSHIESVVQPIVSAKTPESIIDALERNSQQGSTLIKNTLASVAYPDQPIVASMLMRRLGTANPGQQNAAGNLFSPATFLTRYNKMDEGARRAMFDGIGLRQDRLNLEDFAKMMQSIKSSNITLANPSGTAAKYFHLAEWLGAGPTSVAGSIMRGDPATAIYTIGSLLGARQTAWIMTNQPIVRWLSKSADIGPTQWIQQGMLLAQTAKDPKVQDAIGQIVNGLYSQPQRGQ